MDKGGMASAMRHASQQRTLPPSETRIWQDDTRCRFVDPDIFFPGDGVKGDFSNAIYLCAQCPVWRECLRWALDSESNHGMFGGAKPSDRDDIKKGVVRLEDFEPGHGNAKGTVAGFNREKRAGLMPCLACNDANNEASYARKAALREDVA